MTMCEDITIQRLRKLADRYLLVIEKTGNTYTFKQKYGNDKAVWQSDSLEAVQAFLDGYMLAWDYVDA